jgi:hypothetical protein
MSLKRLASFGGSEAPIVCQSEKERKRERVLGFVLNRSSSKRKGCGERDRKSESGGVYLLQPQPYYTNKQRIKIKYHSFLFNFSKFHCFAFLCFFLFSFFFIIYIYIYERIQSPLSF